MRVWQPHRLPMFRHVLKGPTPGVLLGLIPIGLAFLVMRRKWTSVPYYDEWYTPGRHILSFIHGTLRFADLCAQHNESRKLFPNLCYLLFVAVTGRWDVKDAMTLTFALVCFGSVCLYILVRQTTTFSFRGRLCAWAFLNWILFCPRHYENFLWGVQFEPLIPGVLLLAATLVNLSRLKLRLKVIVNSALAFIATYSYANGMLLWLLAAPIPLMGRPVKGKNSLVGWYLCYVLLGALSIVLYFRNYFHPAQLPTFATSISDVIPCGRFLLAWLGNLFTVPGAAPGVVGFLSLALFVAATIPSIKIARQQRNFSPFYPWFTVAIYALISGAIIASGRLRFGLNSALPSRYTFTSVFFYLGLAGLAVDLWHAWLAQPKRTASHWIFASGLIVGLFAAAWLDTFKIQLGRARIIREERKDLALAIQWIPAIPNNPALELAKVPAQVLAAEAVSLSRDGVLCPRLISPALAAATHQYPVDGDSANAALQSARFTDADQVLLTGIAWLPDQKRRADCVVVGFANSTGSLTPFTVFRPSHDREAVKRCFQLNRLPANGFAALVDSANLPAGKLVFRSWAVDLRAQRLLPMTGTLIVRHDSFAHK